MITKIILVLTLELSLLACGGADQSATDKQDAEDAAASDSVTDETVFDPMISTIDKAKGVQKTVDDQQKQWEAALEEAENGKSDDDPGDD